MKITDILADRRLRAPADDGGAGASDAPPADAPAADDAPPATPDAPKEAPAESAPAAPADAPAPTGKNWWDGETYSQEQRDILTSKGLAKGTPEEILPAILKMYEGSQKLLGKGPDRLLTKPDDPAKVGDWMRANAEALGLPKDATGYEIKDLELPEGMERDSVLEGEVQKIAFEEGLSPAAHKRLVEAYAARIGNMSAGIEEDLKSSTAKMQAELQSEWGGQYGAKVTQAQQAFAAFAQQANLDSATQTAMFATLKETGGDPAVMRLFAAIGASMGEDSLAQGQASTLRMTPADARAQLQQLRQEGGDWYKASNENNQARIRELQPKMEELSRIAASG